MRFQKKRFAIAGGILAVFALAVGIFAGISNKKEDAAAVSGTATVTYSNWTGYMNGWRTRDFKMSTADGTLNNARSWCGDVAGASPYGNYTLKTVQITENSSAVEKNLFRAMYYGVEGGYSDVYIHEVISNLLNGDGVAAGELYNRATTWALPNKKNMMLYYTDPNGWGLSAHRYSGAVQRILTYTYEDKQEMELELTKVWRDRLDSQYQDYAYKGTETDYYPEYISVSVTRPDGQPIMNADGTQNATLASHVRLLRQNGYKMTITGLEAGQTFTITEYFAESGMDQDTAAGTWSYGNSPVEYLNEQLGSCTVLSEFKIRCSAMNKEASYNNTSLYLRKIWDDRGYEDLRADTIAFKVRAFAGSEEITSLISDGKLARFIYTVTVPIGSYNHAAYISDLPQSYNGTDVKYYVTERYLPDGVYAKTCKTEVKKIDDEDYCLATPRNNGTEDVEVTFENTPEFINKVVTKTWNDGRGAIFGRPRLLFFDIYRNGEYYDTTGIWNPCYLESAVGRECTDEDEWVLDDLMLPKYYKDTNGEYKVAEYTVEEKDYDFDGGGSGELSKKYIIENTESGTKNTSKIRIPVIKCWLYDDASTRPRSLSFSIIDQYGQGHTTVTLTAANANEQGCWTGESEDLPLFDEQGEMYIYTVRENQTEPTEDYYYDTDVNSCIVDASARKAAAGEDGEIDLSCTFNNRKIEIIKIPVIKCWLNDDETKRPASMKFNLLFDSRVIGTLELTAKDANANGCWTGEFDYLPANDEKGNKLTYYVEEDKSSLEGYRYESDVEQCKVDVAARKAAAKDGEEVDMSCEFNNRYVDVPDTSAKSMNMYYFTIPAMLLGGVFITRKVIARK